MNRRNGDQVRIDRKTCQFSTYIPAKTVEDGDADIFSLLRRASVLKSAVLQFFGNSRALRTDVIQDRDKVELKENTSHFKPGKELRDRANIYG